MGEPQPVGGPASMVKGIKLMAIVSPAHARTAQQIGIRPAHRQRLEPAMAAGAIHLASSACRPPEICRAIRQMRKLTTKERPARFLNRN
ncbi:hypothetical protein LXM94_02800 [Rhizobium sp. TRM95111]|uniref:hypothetical protein n=1 Tax=Rhizobium alarense TaxID=2846851 RepID=UPI001F443BCB|nr:hypothetical protein [Rhizobium alarense]MCF3638897.1 hypothetical protein [Rhizobium alarense]